MWEEDVATYFTDTFHRGRLLYMPQRDKDYVSKPTKVVDVRREVDDVEKSHSAEKEEFRMKMESLAARRRDVETQQNALKESLLKFNTFISENDSKRWRAKQKMLDEREMTRQKEGEIDKLLREQDSLESRLTSLKKKVDRFSIYSDYMNSVRHAGGYVDARAVITRHNTLINLLAQLRARENQRALMLDALTSALTLNQTEAADRVMLMHTDIAGMQKTLEQREAATLKWEKTVCQLSKTASEKMLQAIRIKWSTFQMYALVMRRMGHPLETDDFEEQITEVGNYISDMNKVLPDIVKGIIQTQRQASSLRREMMHQGSILKKETLQPKKKSRAQTVKPTITVRSF